MESTESAPRRRRDVLAGLEALEVRTTAGERPAPSALRPVVPPAATPAAPSAPGVPAAPAAPAPPSPPANATAARIRARGPLVALVPPLVLGVAAVLVLRSSTDTAGGAAGFLLAVLGAPLLVVAGAPLRAGSGVYATALIGSAVLWLALGLWAARRTTRRPAPRWAGFWGEYAWMAASVWIGVAVSLLLSSLAVGRILI